MEQDFDFFEGWVYKNLGIDLTAYKSKQLHRRILSMMNRSGYGNLKDYSKAILENDELRIRFLDYITINVTEFFRNKEMFDDLEVKIKDRLINKYPKLKIWSAACSIGAEPYSLSIILDKISKGKPYNIVATDIDENILKRARQGIYQSHEVKNVSLSDRKKYFKEKDEKFYINDHLKNHIQFKKHDLILDSYEKNFHLIICRNVVIYFNNDAKEKIYKQFYESLVPGGLLFVGATESIYNYKELGFEKISTFLYQKKQ